MKLSKTSEYAVRILVYMAQDTDRLYSAKVIGNALDIPYKYLTRLLTNLNKSGFITSIKGRSGGFKFSKPLDSIFLYQIIDAVEDIEGYLGCILGFSQCDDKNPCALHGKWIYPKALIVDMLRNTTLEEMSGEGGKF